ncbi:ornithine cyclodeaminase family protein [Hominifimenecus sp. rT4P-3]|uniref:ornithine cyclodeaminase family protein n=1 Tax=Hominifimenecus sp. rT4P-3 TaxID=3242979 RepID=UPI003DA20D7B
MLYLNDREMRKAVGYDEMMDAIEEAFLCYHQGSYHMPDRYTASYQNRKMLYMPCFAKDVIGTKMLAEFPENPAKGLPYLSGLMILNDQETGQPIAIMDGSTLTALRTGAVGGVAIRHLSYPDSTSVGLVGCGVQGLHQLVYACQVRPIQECYLYDMYRKDYTDFIERLKEMTAFRHLSITVCSNSREVAEKSDIILTATQAQTPVFPEDPSLFRKKCVVAIGSWLPDHKEIPDAIWQTTKTVLTDLPFACEESGDLCQPLQKGLLHQEDVHYMADFLYQKNSGQTPPLDETRYYKSVGMGLFDVMAARLIWKCAKERNCGQILEK